MPGKNVPESISESTVPTPSIYERVTICLQVLYMLRVPVLLSAAIFLFPLIAQFVAPTLLAGLYDFSERPFLAAFWYSLFVFLFAWAVMMATKLVVNYGPRRMGLVDDDARKWFRGVRNVSHEKRTVFKVVMGLAIFALSGVFWVKCGAMSAGYRWWILGGMIPGFLLAFLLLFIADLIHSTLYKPENTSSLRFMLFPFDVPWLERRRQRPQEASSFIRFIKKVFPEDGNSFVIGFNKRAKRLTDWFKGQKVLSRGYFAVLEKDSPNGPIGISGHITALTMAVVFITVYLAFGFGDVIPNSFGGSSAGISYQHRMGVPAIVYLPILATVLCWFLGSLSFFLDSYRIPLLAPILAWVLVMSPLQEHYYHVTPVAKNPTPLLENTPQPGDDDFIIVVAADGGGIQAAAWTAKVLTGIEKQCQEAYGFSCARRIKLISAVSGGSVGTMYFVDALHDGNLNDDELKDITLRARASSLRSVAWGIAYPDFINGFVPVIREDRGRELEKDWGRNLRVPGSADVPDIKRLEKPLSEWKPGVSAGWRPDVVFNATMVETGARVMITTSDLLNEPKHPRTDASYTFHDIYPDRDIPVASAARLSASFPYVTPVARGRFDTAYQGFENAHLADGGYFDNYGVLSALDWLEKRFRLPNPPKKVIFVQIRCGDIVGAQQQAAGKEDDGQLSLSQRSQGGFYQAIAPLLTLYNVRTAGQREHADRELQQFMDIWNNRQDGKQVAIEKVTFNFFEGVKNPEEPPLSWHLTPKEQKDIDESWDRVLEIGHAWEGFKNAYEKLRAIK